MSFIFLADVFEQPMSALKKTPLRSCDAGREFCPVCQLKGQAFGTLTCLPFRCQPGAGGASIKIEPN
jgi:hypothetical protein